MKKLREAIVIMLLLYIATSWVYLIMLIMEMLRR